MLDQPQIHPLDDIFSKSTLIGHQCLESIILKTIVQDHFYVVDKSRLQEGAIISTTWLVEACELYELQFEEPYKSKMKKFTETNQQMPKKISIPFTQPSPTLR